MQSITAEIAKQFRAIAAVKVVVLEPGFGASLSAVTRLAMVLSSLLQCDVEFTHNGALYRYRYTAIVESGQRESET